MNPTEKVSEIIDFARKLGDTPPEPERQEKSQAVYFDDEILRLRAILKTVGEEILSRSDITCNCDTCVCCRRLSEFISESLK